MSHTPSHDNQVLRIVLIEGLANVLVLTMKLIVGLSTGSLAVLADAVHSLTDVANNIVAWVVLRISSRPADKEHPYGHRKFETLLVFGLAALLSVLAFELAIQAIKKEPTEIISGGWELALMLTVLGVNISISTWERHWAKKLNSDILLADASHTFADVLTTIVVIIGWQLSAAGYPWLDKLCALGVAGLILYLAYTLFKRALPILVDEYAIDPELIINTAKSVNGVRDVKQVRSRWVGSMPVVDMVITVNPDISTEESHHIADKIEALLKNKHQIHDVSIHVEPDV